MSRSSHWTRADSLNLPPRAKSAWQISRVTTQAAQDILNYACWPKRAPKGAVPIEVSENGITVFELVGAMQVANRRRGRDLTKTQYYVLREMVRKALIGKIVGDDKLNELYESLNI